MLAHLSVILHAEELEIPAAGKQVAQLVWSNPSSIFCQKAVQYYKSKLADTFHTHTHTPWHTHRWDVKHSKAFPSYLEIWVQFSARFSLYFDKKFVFQLREEHAVTVIPRKPRKTLSEQDGKSKWVSLPFKLYVQFKSKLRVWHLMNKLFLKSICWTSWQICCGQTSFDVCCSMLKCLNTNKSFLII